MTDYIASAGTLADQLRPLVLAACDGDPPEHFGSSCLDGTPMIPLHRGTVSAIYQHLADKASLEKALARALDDLKHAI